MFQGNGSFFLRSLDVNPPGAAGAAQRGAPGEAWRKRVERGRAAWEKAAARGPA